ncbi:PilZ domain-containing protein [Novosphingobium sp. TH158]|uniref:PilZ domain-containing protein n=1 Tax=Novosphingobium sp. TH158 TaxID=2067455 RepID=UPI001304034D|nr:PilZ domain-containing protein [Novosphingobium sp. TH158]
MPGTESVLGPGFDGLEKREVQRLVLLLRPAKVIARSGEYLCILRDVASRGARLKLFHPLPRDVLMVLELGNGDRYDIEKIWERGDQAGFVFTHAAQLEHLLVERSRFRKRPVRARVDLPAQVRAGSVVLPAALCNISQQGGSIEGDLPLSVDQRVTLAVKGLPELDAKVRWRRGNRVGLVFEQTFKLDELARLLHRLQPFPPAVAEDEKDAIFRRAMEG